MNKTQRKWHIEACQTIAKQLYADNWQSRLNEAAKDQSQLWDSTSVQPVQTVGDLSDGDLKRLYNMLIRLA